MRATSHSPMAYGPFFRARAFFVRLIGHRGLSDAVGASPPDVQSRVISPGARGPAFSS
jgi:hypothetical protein